MDNRKLSKKGRHGDTHIRDVYGIKSHVNKDEAKLIDSYGLLGEVLVKDIGSGTTNPITGLPEYHMGWRHIGSGHNLAHILYSAGEGFDPHKKDSPLIVGAVGQGNILGGVTEGEYTLTNEEKAAERDAEEERKGGPPVDRSLGYDSGIKWIPQGGNYNVNMTSEIWNEMSEDEKIDYIAMVEFGGEIPAEYDTIADFKTFMKNKIANYAPVKGDIDPTASGILGEQYGPGGIAGREADITYGAAGRTYEKAGLAYETAGLAYETADIKKETMLGGLQESAYQVGAPTTGRDLRGAIRGKQKIKKAFETGTDIYDIAGKTYDIAGKAYDIASGTYGAAGETYDLAGDRADLSYRSGMHMLGKAPEGTWQTNWSDFLESLSTPS